MQQSEIKVSPSAVVYSGPDATALFRAAALREALRLYAKSKIVIARGVTPTSMLSMATKITGKPYRRGEYTKAADEVDTWVQTMKAALPITITK